MRNNGFSRREILKGSTALIAGSVFAEPVRAAAPPPEAITPALIAAAKKEGKVAFYTAMDLAFAGRLGKTFEAKFPGIAVRVERSGAERIFTRIGQEYTANIHAVDVVNTADQSHCIVWKRNGWLLPYLPEEVAKHYDKVYYDPDGLHVTTRILVSPIAYNTNLVKKEEAPKSFADLLDPKWKGKIVKAHPAYSGTIMNATFQIARDLGWGYLEKLAAQNVLQVQSATDTPKKIALGERAIMADGAGYLVIRNKEAGPAGRDRLSDRGHAARHRAERGVQGRAQSQRRAPVPELDALPRGPAGAGRLGAPVFAAQADRGEARHPQARRHQADEGGPGGRGKGRRGDQAALRADLQGVSWWRCVIAGLDPAIHGAWRKFCTIGWTPGSSPAGDARGKPASRTDR